MIIESNKVVSIVYDLRKDSVDGEIVESLKIDQPLVFLFGTGNLLPKFEENLNGLKKDDKFSFMLKTEEAYGPVQENAIVDVPLDVFKVDGQVDHSMVKVGNAIPMLDNEGRRLNGLVISISDESVKMDFNHPMAGSDLFFNGKVTDIREPNADELKHGHVHSSGSCGNCGDEGCGSSGHHHHDHDHDHHHHH
ncbi:MAG: peptidylprolyl isomerase [Bacteroidales bacterium]|nr:peptidylprolyl isomerase [Bacteroidales bacterium]MCF8391745.1 peptidylprolyl isomerase [Bacteroidales bacterium]